MFLEHQAFGEEVTPEDGVPPRDDSSLFKTLSESLTKSETL